jgi:N-acetylmuramoyl-L-alanine amidase
MPAVLLEMGYITNKHQLAAVVTTDGETRAAEAIFSGLKKYFTNSDAPNVVPG